MTDKGMPVQLGRPSWAIYTPDSLRITAEEIRKAIEQQKTTAYYPKRKWTPRRWR